MNVLSVFVAAKDDPAASFEYHAVLVYIDERHVYIHPYDEHDVVDIDLRHQRVRIAPHQETPHVQQRIRR